jgi:imidazolonepropionase-like amidohydrolase
MCRSTFACVLLVAALAGCSTPPPAPPPTDAVLYEGARLIPGDETAVIDESAFLVENGTIARIGKKGEVTGPEGVTRVDLTGKTVMPTLVNSHGHPGFQRGLSYSGANVTRENVIDDMNRAAYFGVAAVQSQGIEPGDAMYQVRSEQEAGTLGGALLRVAGTGIGGVNAGPGSISYAGIGAWVEAPTPEEGVRIVEGLAAKRANSVKIWVDDWAHAGPRGIARAKSGPAQALKPAVYTAIIHEAHKRGMKVMAHLYYHADAAALAAAGVDGFAHLVRDKVMDDALVALLVQRGVYQNANVAGSERATYPSLPPYLADGDPMMKLLRESVPPEVVQRMVDAFKDRDAKSVADERGRYDMMARTWAKLNAAGARLMLGADTGTQDNLFGFAEHRELEVMVRAGMTPAQGIVAATSRPAEYMGLNDLGTLAPGKQASFIVLDANPLDDITNTRRIAHVYFKGRRLDRAAMRTRLTAATTAR